VNFVLTVHAEYVRVFKAFTDEKRIAVLKMLAGGEMCACQILENLDICQSSLSYHMKILVESGVVENRQEGKWTYYKISHEGKNHATALLDSIAKVRESMFEGARCC
jgi:ArsR family transcriptional regulator, arsenate/arsenite/antimonite-responsive transcriptional repressor